MNGDDGIIVGRLGDRFRATLWEGGEPVLWAEDSSAEEAIAALNARRTPLAASAAQAVAPVNSRPNVQPPAVESRIVIATKGSLNNTYISVRGFMDLFEPDTIGGRNKESYAARKVTVEWEGQPGMETDIDGHHKSLRNRSLVSRFIRDSGLVAGDQVEVKRLAPYRYRLSRLRSE